VEQLGAGNGAERVQTLPQSALEFIGSQFRRVEGGAARGARRAAGVGRDEKTSLTRSSSGGPRPTGGFRSWSRGRSVPVSCCARWRSVGGS